MSMCLLECCVLKSCPTFLHANNDRQLDSHLGRAAVPISLTGRHAEEHSNAMQACDCGQVELQHHTTVIRLWSGFTATVAFTLPVRVQDGYNVEAEAHPAHPSCTLFGTPDGLEPANLRPAVTRVRLGWLTSLRRGGRSGKVAGGARADVVREETLLANCQQLFAVQGLGVRRHAVDPASDGPYVVLQVQQLLSAERSTGVSVTVHVRAMALQIVM